MKFLKLIRTNPSSLIGTVGAVALLLLVLFMGASYSALAAGGSGGGSGSGSGSGASGDGDSTGGGSGGTSSYLVCTDGAWVGDGDAQAYPITDPAPCIPKSCAPITLTFSNPDTAMIAWWGTSYNPMDHWSVDGVTQVGAIGSGQNITGLTSYGPGDHTVRVWSEPQTVGQYCSSWGYVSYEGGGSYVCNATADATQVFSCEVGFTNPTTKPVCTSITTTPDTITEGQSSTLSWSSTGATSASIDNGIGSVSGSDSRTVSPTVNTTYTLTLTNSAGNTTCQAGVTVNPAYPDLVSQNLGILGGGTSIQVGTSTQFTAIVKNNGAATDAGFTDVFLYSLNGGAFIQIPPALSKGPLAAGAQSTDNSSGVTFNSAGLVTIRHCVDNGEVIGESDETNNCSDRTYEVTAPPNWPDPLCSVSPNPANVGQSVTWSSTVTGGTAPYAYLWSGTGLSGTNSSVTRSYSTPGDKAGQVTVSDNLGRSATKVCPTLVVIDPDVDDVEAFIWARAEGTSAWQADSVNIGLSDQAEIRWDSNNATSCTGDSHYSTGGAESGTQSADSVEQPEPESSLQYRVTCTDGTDSDTDTVWVNRSGDDTAPPTLTVDPSRVRLTEPTYVTATLNGHTGCVVTGRGIDPDNSDGDNNGDTLNLGGSDLSDHETDGILGETTYRLTCTSGGTAEATVYILPTSEHR